MEAIILAGGFGTRLKHVISDVPKPMAPVCEKPFLKYIMDYLLGNGVHKFVMAVGYKKEIIKNYFGEEYKNAKITYSVEAAPLFTGGAIKKALQECKDREVFIINGDTFFDVNLAEMKRFHCENNAMLTIATKEMFDFDRYGSVVTNNNKIVSFEEKKFMKQGFINGGIYYANRELLDSINIPKFSFEINIMKEKVKEIPMFAFKCDGYFIDIGIPEDYFKAQADFQRIEGKNE